jgi:thiol-disulfide isomerase/thioredoxin
MNHKALLLLLLFFSCAGFAQRGPQPLCYFGSPRNTWQGALLLNDSTRLEFFFDINTSNGKTGIKIYNGEEVISVSEVTSTKDSLKFKMPVFDSEFKLARVLSRDPGEDVLSGVWINHARRTKNILGFTAHTVKTKPVSLCGQCNSFAGKWETTFSPGVKDDEYAAVGIFTNAHCWDLIYGTFLTETGDYRYLSGFTGVDKDDTIMRLQCFDGAHAFLFTGKKQTDGTIDGDFYSGAYWHEKWTAKRNDRFELRDPDSLTFLKPGSDKIDFTFKDLEGKPVSLHDEKFKNKVVIVQLMGSWCPNCMDETKFFAELYKKYKNKGVEIIALAFEKDTAFAKAKSNLERLKKKYGIGYDILITQKTGKDQASDALPMLNAVMAFPTTIYVDKQGRIRKIYTGFYGPGTGEYFYRFENTTLDFLNKLIAE